MTNQSVFDDGCTFFVDVNIKDKKGITLSKKADYRFGAICPNCREAVLDYDGLLNLVCSKCGPVQGGCFT